MTKAQREYFLREQLRSIQQELGEEDEDGRAGRAAAADRGGRPAGGGPPRGRARAGAAWPRPAGLAGARHHPHLPGLDGQPALEQADRRRDRRAAGPRRSWTRTTTTWRRSRTASWSTWRSRSCARSAQRAAGVPNVGRGTGERRDRRAAPNAQPETPTRPRAARADPLLRRAAGRRQDQPRAVDRAGAGARSSCGSRLGGVHDEAEIRGHRRTYIGALPGPHHPGASGGPRPATRSSCWTRSTRSAPTGAATRRRRCWRCSTRPRTTAFVDNYLGVPFDLSQVLFIDHREHARHDPGAAARPDGGAPALRLHRRGEGPDRAEVPGAEADRGPRPARRRS